MPMKNDFHPGEFITMLQSVGNILRGIVDSKQFQELTNNQYYQSVDFTLVDALQAIEQTADAYEEMQCHENNQLTPR